MNPIGPSVAAPMFVLCAVAVFVILFAIILRTLRQMPFFDGSNPVPVAVCVTLLCILGLHQVFVQPAGTETAPADDARRSLDFLLMPYAAMALAVLLTFCLLLLHKVARSQGYARLRAKMARQRERRAALRDSSGQALQDSMSSRPSQFRSKDRCGPFEHADRLKEPETAPQKKAIRKWNS